ncbi:MAG: amidohydrolase family protein, partial [Planctomycetota bacterium]|nr:amidohydrolase family protein [Planctomycetota bacterium]
MSWISNKLAVSLLLTGLAAGTTAQAEASAQKAGSAGDDTYAVHCGRLLTGDGKEYEHGWLLVSNGKVVSAGNEKPPEGTRVIDALSRVVMPGIVAVDTDLAVVADDQYAVTPDALAIDGFDFELRLRDALEGGVTTAYLSPGRQRLISGQGAIVKTDGDDLVERILSENAALRVNFGDGGVSAPAVFEPTIHPTDDDPLVPARVQTPTARIGMLPELRALFAEAGQNTAAQGEGSVENRYDPAALRAAVAGQMPVRAAAWKATDIRRALMLQKELGLTMVLENPQHIAPLANQAQAQSVAATFRVPAQPGRRSTGSEDRRQKSPEPRLDAPARAAAAGMTIGLAPSAGVPLRDYLMAVGLAVRGGLPVDHALRAIGADAAKVLGVEDRVGVLAPGKDADFIVLSGDPFAIGTMVESTWIDGHKAYERHNEQTLLAIRCGKILDGAGHVYRDGVLVIQGSRIKAIGEDLAIPYGARVIDLGSAVMTPGFVDAFSHLGLAGDGSGVPGGASNQLLVEAIPHDDPMFEPALAAGITTVLTSGKDGGLVSGRITAVKTGAADREAMVVRPIAGQRMVFNAIGPDAEKPLRDQLERGKKYAKSWADYEKALLEWSGKESPKPPEPEPEPETGDKEKPAATADPVTGTWETNLDLGPFQLTMFFDLKLAGTKVTGQVRIRVRDRERPPQDISSGSYKDGTLTLEFSGMGGEATLTGKIEKDTL